MKRMNRCHYKKGGYIKKIGNRHYFATGGNTAVNPTTLSGPGGSNGQGGVPGAGGVTGTISNALGLNNNFQVGNANLQAGTNAAQLNNAYTGATNAIANQNNLVNTLTPQAAEAVNNQNAAAALETGVMNGTGPNPAQAALNQNTGVNIAQQAALNAGVRGGATNAGLIAAQNANVGAATQQNAVGQAATLEANQSLNAAQNLENLANNQINQTGQAITNQNSVNQGEQAILQNANTALNNANVGMQSNINNVNSQTAAANQNMNANVLGGIMSGASSVLGSLFAEGGEVDPVNEGTFKPSSDSANGPNVPGTSALPADTTSFAKAMGGDNGGSGGGGGGGGGGGIGSLVGMAAAFLKKGGNVCAGPHSSHVANFMYADGGETSDMVPAMVSPGERYLNPREVKQVVEEGANPMSMGKVYGGKAKVKGDSYKNDTVPDTLEEGGVVIPRHVETKKDRHKSELFVRRAVHMKRPAHKGL